MSGQVLVLGGRSDIGLAIAHRFAEAGHAVTLAARNATTLEETRIDIELRHRIVAQLAEFDILDTPAMAGFVASLAPAPEIVICVVGTMGDQEESQRLPEAAALVMRSNYEGPALILGLFAQEMEKKGRGTLVGVSSVAGDRGRASNYVYGSAKAGFTAFLSGLRNRLSQAGVHVITIKPGFVATRMTEGMNLPTALTAQPQEVAEAIYRAVEKRKNVVHVKWVWEPIMLIIRALPEFIFKRTSL
ncbi:SDR family oxidoreductase [Rhizobium sp. KVB221]|uniref:SDR family oxidoreductase n=1 Tax=Rhizobium setariae TaxID=2801340 RepID=A0A937CR01_9HYPH|nr:SDR family oxidoreductase [Rhizobium setariae]MBL0373702.1 SDR family oxidoreductase [Rhizobium setariae]